MKIRSFFELDAGVYRVRVQTEDWSEGDKDLMDQFGEPEIDVGGSFSGGSDGPDYTLATQLKLIMSESPFNESFDSDDFPTDAEARANVWQDEIADRITTAIVALRALMDDFTREEVEEV